MAGKVTVIPASRTREKCREKTGKIRVAAYCRVSTDQEEQLGSFENQVEYYTKLINSNPNYEMAGVFADEGISGTGVKKREGFKNLIKACEDGKVDKVITKSISRFARNTAHCLEYARKLKDLGIPIVFEKEGINTMEASGELLFTILSSLAQEESRNISENTAWGIRSKFNDGVPHINTTRFMGYDMNKEGKLVINPEQAVIVKRIYREYLEGYEMSEIGKSLKKDGVPGVTGKVCWSATTIHRMLVNEKYKGDLLLQKYYTVDYLTKEQAENRGEQKQFYVEDAHDPIISKQDWTAVQMEIERREKFRDNHGITETGCCTGNEFFSKVFCSNCGGKLVRKYWTGIHVAFWKCENAEKRKGCTCSSSNIKEASLKNAFMIMWNCIVDHREEMLPRWIKMKETGNDLQKVRGRQMIDLTAEGLLEKDLPELTKMVLDEISVIKKDTFRIRLLDGTEKTIVL